MNISSQDSTVFLSYLESKVFDVQLMLAVIQRVISVGTQGTNFEIKGQGIHGNTQFACLLLQDSCQEACEEYTTGLMTLSIR